MFRTNMNGHCHVNLSPGSCSHCELEENRDKEWIEKGSPAHLALTKIVLDKRFLNNIHYYLNFRHELSECLILHVIIIVFTVY